MPLFSPLSNSALAEDGNNGIVPHICDEPLNSGYRGGRECLPFIRCERRSSTRSSRRSLACWSCWTFSSGTNFWTWTPKRWGDPWPGRPRNRVQGVPAEGYRRLLLVFGQVYRYVAIQQFRILRPQMEQITKRRVMMSKHIAQDDAETHPGTRHPESHRPLPLCCSAGEGHETH